MPVINSRLVVEQLSRWTEGAVEGLREALPADVEVTKDLARDVYCPIDTGRLRSTARTHVQRRGDRLVTEITFGGPAADYAGFVHERLDLHHKPPTQAKYLQRAVDERMPTLPARLARRMNAAARRRASL